MTAIDPNQFVADLQSYCSEGRPTQRVTRRCVCRDGAEVEIPVFVNHFWLRGQRVGSSLHRVAGREMFSPLLARFFIETLSRPNDIVYDCCMGRGTAPIEAALLGRVPFGTDANPLCAMIVQPRLRPQPPHTVNGRIRYFDEFCHQILPSFLRPIFHPETLFDLCSLRDYFLRIQEEGPLDDADSWVRMLVIISLGGPRVGYLIGPSIHANTPMLPTRFWRPRAPEGCLLPKKELFNCLRLRSESLTATWDPLARRAMEAVVSRAVLLTARADETSIIQAECVSLIVTGPPGLKSFSYRKENWLKCWFVDLDPDSVNVSAHRVLDDWAEEMTRVFEESYRVLKPGGYCALDIGRLRPRKIRWDDVVLDCALSGGFEPVGIIVNTKFYGRSLLERPFLTRESLFDEVLVLRKP